MFWKKEKPTKIYRVTYRARNGSVPLIAEILIKSKRDKPEIDFRDVIKGYWEKKEHTTEFDEILFVEKIGEE